MNRVPIQAIERENSLKYNPIITASIRATITCTSNL